MARKDFNLPIFKANIKQAQRELIETKVRLAFYKHMLICNVWKDKAYAAARRLDFDYILQSKEFTEEEKAPVLILKNKIK